MSECPLAASGQGFPTTESHPTHRTPPDCSSLLPWQASDRSKSGPTPGFLGKDRRFMTKALIRAVLASMVLAGLAGLAPAAEAKTATPHVVIVGVNEFADKQINPRPNAEADAQALADLFTN